MWHSRSYAGAGLCKVPVQRRLAQMAARASWLGRGYRAFGDYHDISRNRCNAAGPISHAAFY
jgi:hypothetical protein